MNLLIDESPLVVLPSLAKALGDVNEAIVLQQIHYWLGQARQSKTATEHDGRTWTYNSVKEWREQFSWLTPAGVRHVLDRLRNKKVVLVKHLQPLESDRRLSYTIDYDELDKLTHLPSTANGLPPRANGLPPRAIVLPPTANVLYPKTPTETSSDTCGLGQEPQPREALKAKKPRSEKQAAYDIPLNAFAEAYKKVYGADYVFSAGRDHAVIRDLIRQSPSKNGEFAAEFKRRLDLAIKQHVPGDKWEQFPQDLSTLRLRWNRLVESSPAPTSTIPPFGSIERAELEDRLRSQNGGAR